MKLKKNLIFMTLVLSTALLVNSCSSGKYCEGGKRKYKRMKRDTNMMVF